MPNAETVSKTAYEIESELKGSSANRTGFGGRPVFVNWYVWSENGSADVSSLPILDSLDIDALRCGKMIPFVTVASENHDEIVSQTCFGMADVRSDSIIIKLSSANKEFEYNITNKTWDNGEDGNDDVKPGGNNAAVDPGKPQRP